MTTKTRQNLSHLGLGLAPLLMSGGHVAFAQDNVFELGKLKADITVIGEALRPRY